MLDLVSSRLETIGEDFVSGRDLPRYRQWIGTLFGPLARDLAWAGPAGESDARRQRRATVLHILGETGRDPLVLRRARRMAAQYMANPGSLDPVLAETVLSLAAINGDRRLYERYVAKLGTTATPTEYYRYLRAIAAFEDRALVARSLEYFLSTLNSQDTGILIAMLLNNPAARRQTWEFIKSRWNEFEQKLGTFQGIPTIIAATASFCDVEGRDDVKQFFTTYPVSSAERTIRESLETIQSCIDLKSRQADKLAAWIRTRPQQRQNPLRNVDPRGDPWSQPPTLSRAGLRETASLPTAKQRHGESVPTVNPTRGPQPTSATSIPRSSM